MPSALTNKFWQHLKDPHPKQLKKPVNVGTGISEDNLPSFSNHIHADQIPGLHVGGHTIKRNNKI